MSKKIVLIVDIHTFQCPQGVILNLKPGNDSPETSREDHAPLDKFTGLTEDQMHDNRTEQR